MKIKALIFDFDGLILDTETPEFRVWQEIYAEYGQVLTAEQWGQIVGGWGISDFDAAENLADLVGDGANPQDFRARQKAMADKLVLDQPVLPGVVDYLDEAGRLDLRMAIASSSPHSWVDTHLKRLNLYTRFASIICADDVAPGRTKPNPDLFLKALGVLGLEPDQAIVFEDSPNGVQAAREAGIFVVAVPNPMTALLRLRGQNLKLKSLTDMPLGELCPWVNCWGDLK
jgi:HAD superfamily hydrolase (TIGR01509 family)